MVAIPLAVGGVILQGMGDVDAASPFENPLGLIGMLLFVIPLTLSLNITMRRRRDAAGASSIDSVEFRAAQQARSQAFGDALLLGAVLFLTLAVVADTIAALTAVGFMILAVGAFWIRYHLALRALGG